MKTIAEVCADLVIGNNNVTGDHFEFWTLGNDGAPFGNPIRVRTETGLILQCHPACDTDQIRYLAEVARQTPNYPVDICAWIGNPGNKNLQWSARIYYRRAGYGSGID